MNMGIRFRKSIKFKIFGIFILLLVVLMANSIWAVINFYGLRKSIDNIMDENYRSIIAAQNMIIALERQDSAELSYLFELNPEAVNTFKENEVIFYEWYTRAGDNITEVGEKEILNNIKYLYSDYTQGFYNLMQGAVKSDIKSYYYETLFPLFEQVKDSCRELLTVNQNSMVELKDRAEITARKAAYSTLCISIGTILFGLLIAYYLTSKIVNPLHILIEKIKGIAEGDYTQKLNIKGDDEIAELANEFNTMAEKLRYYDLLNIKKLMQEKQKAEAIVESINDGVIVTDNDNKVLLMNKAAERVFNLKEKEVLGKHFLEVINNEKILSIINKVKNRKSSDGYKKYSDFSLNEGSKKYYRINVVPILDKKGDNIGIVTLIQDITKLKEIDNMKSDFISKVSHEFRTPLTSVAMAVGLLLDKVPGKINKEQKELLHAIQQDEKRLADFVDELLDLSRIESGKIQMDLKPCRIKDIAERAVNPLKMQAEEKKIKIKIDKTKDAPKVKADFNKIIWVFANLVGNAIRYTPADGSGLIEIKFKEVGKKILVSVSDNGKGISEDFQKVVFEKFVQVKDKNEPSEGGAGLGLAISKEIITAHGGDIWVKSELKKGSTFYFTLNRS